MKPFHHHRSCSTLYKTKKLHNRIAALCLVLALLLCVFERGQVLAAQAHFVPEYAQVSIEQIIQDGISEADYKTLFYQTGLGRRAIDELLLYPDGLIRLEDFQKNFFAPITVKSESIAAVTFQESAVNSYGASTLAFRFAPCKDGYVLVTKCTHTLGWRHGHMGLAVNNGGVLEAAVIGTNSTISSMQTWRVNPTFIMLRLKNATNDQLFEIAEDAKAVLEGIPYALSTGIFSKKEAVPRTTQCAHLVWYAFYQHGIDTDSDGGGIVTVDDVINSGMFEVVQIYGVNPDDWFEK